MKIEKQIYVIREQKIMLDSDLADLYQVDTKILIQAVKRNLSRFPPDYMFVCDFSEIEDLRSQFVTANRASFWNHKRRTTPLLFTEAGIAMLSTVLKSERAIQVNISIIRTFIRLRSYLSMENTQNEKVEQLAEATNKLFKVVFERMDTIEEIMQPKQIPSRKKIGLK